VTRRSAIRKVIASLAFLAVVSVGLPVSPAVGSVTKTSLLSGPRLGNLTTPTGCALPQPTPGEHCVPLPVQLLRQEYTSKGTCSAIIFMQVPLRDSIVEYDATWAPPNQPASPRAFTATGGPNGSGHGPYAIETWSTKVVAYYGITYKVPKGFGAWLLGAGGGSAPCTNLGPGVAQAWGWTTQPVVSGKVTLQGSGGQPASGVTVRASCPSGGTTTSDATGAYGFPLRPGTCTIAPRLAAGEMAVPKQRVVSVTTQDIKNVDFQVPGPLNLDWTVPERYDPTASPPIPAASDINPADGLPTAAYANPSRWPATVFLTDNQGRPKSTCPIGKYTWTVKPKDPAIKVNMATLLGKATTCAQQFDFPALGVYTVSLKITQHGNTVATGGLDVIMKDFLMVGLGDSFGSGEGTPNVAGAYKVTATIPPGTVVRDLFDAWLYDLPTPVSVGLHPAPAASWELQQCHRSVWSYQSLVAQQIEWTDAHSSVTFLGAACSGARIRDLVNVHFEGEDPSAGAPLQPQLKQVYDRIVSGGHLTREVDSVLLSIGGNDIHFSTIVKTCAGLASGVLGKLAFGQGQYCPDVLVKINDADNQPTAYAADGYIAQAFKMVVGAQPDKGPPLPGMQPLSTVVNQSIKNLTDSYGRLASYMREYLAIDPKRVLVTGYPLPITDTNGHPCGTGFPFSTTYNPILASSATASHLGTLFGLTGGITAAESGWIATDVGPGLNGEIASDAQAFGWTYLAKTATEGDGHGFCENLPTRYVWLPLESIVNVGSPDGAMHPTRPLLQAEAADVRQALVPQLFEQDLPRDPRTLAQIRSTTVHPYP
jgi:hypothetical protein